MKKNIILMLFVFVSLLFYSKVEAFESYKVGDEIFYKNSNYFVIENSDSEQNYVTLLKEKPLEYSEFSKYVDGIDVDYDINGFISNARFDVINQILLIVNNWSNDTFSNDDLIEVNNYKARLIDANDILNLGFTLEFRVSSYSLIESDDTPRWFNDVDYCYYTMIFDPSDSDDDKYAYRIPNYCSYNQIRPVIHLNKTVIEKNDDIVKDDCKTYKKYNIYKEYKIGDEVYLNGEKYHVIRNSNDSLNYVTLLKDDPLTYDEISQVNYGLSEITNSNGIGMIKYDDQDESLCYHNECSADYYKSSVKKVVDNWSLKFQNNLIKVDGYKTRLLTVDELQEYFYYTAETPETSLKYSPTEDTPNWVLGNSDKNACWTMTGYQDGDKRGYVNGSVVFAALLSSTYCVRPVLNINKCALDDGCQIGKKVIEDNCVSDVENKDVSIEEEVINNREVNKPIIINVDNTLKMFSKIVLIISIILITIGIALLIFNYILPRKKMK